MKKFLFFDYWTLEHVKGFERRTISPVKHEKNPVFVPDERPYEFNDCMYFTVLYDPGEERYRMWYGTSNLYDENTTPVKYLCHATSMDGIRWERPALDVVPGTNIVMDDAEKAMGSSVILDARDTVLPYKLLMRPKHTPAIVAYASRDGIHWEKCSDEPVIQANSDCKIGLYQDPDTGIYHALFRLNKGNRKTWTSESRDFLQWSRPVLILEPDIAEGTQVQIYGTQASPYGNYVIGLAPLYNTEPQEMFWAKMRGTMDMALAFSRGGYAWKWMEPGSRFIPLGGAGEWDAGMIHPGTSLVYCSEEIRIYYSGTVFPHHETERVTEQPKGIGLATIRPDGFVALVCNSGGGSLLTRPFAISTPEILVNADCSKGVMRMEICEGGTGLPLRGYAMEDCEPIVGDGTAIAVRWKNNGSCESLVNRSIRIRIAAENTLLYSISMPNGKDPARYWEFEEIGCVDPVRDLGTSDYYMQV
ncbi:MAG: hypothetical protein R6W96_10250 [Clostridia bacterium]